MKKHFLLLILSLLFLPIAQGKVKLPAMMGDHMVLQQNSSVKLWGWADGKKVTVTTSWNNRTYQASTDKDGTWLVKVDTPKGGYTPYSITISDGAPVTLSDILIGEVWICSGQSNMEMRMMGNAAQPIDNSLEVLLNSGNYRDRIRFITVPRTNDTERRTDFEKRKWEVSSPETTIDCSAAAYFFARQLTESLHLPVGLVINSWGGSAIEAAKNPKRGVHQRLECLYNSMLWPVKNFTARGFLWYQGESNRDNAGLYQSLMPAFVTDLRAKWGRGELPFYFVQIAPFNYEGADGTSAARLREVQLQNMKDIPNSGMVTTMDVGHPVFIHPVDKETVGNRLAYWALAQTYGMKGFGYAPPVYKSMEIQENKIYINFDHAQRGLSPMWTSLKGFEIAGEDKVFHPAFAEIETKTARLAVSSDKVPHPVAVRYAYKNYVEASIFSIHGIPAAPFRTDNW